MRVGCLRRSLLLAFMAYMTVMASPSCADVDLLGWCLQHGGGEAIDWRWLVLLALTLTFLGGACCGAVCVLGCQAAMGRKKRRNEEDDREEYFRVKAKLLKLTASELHRLCMDHGYHAGSGCTKEAMARGLLAENICSLPAEVRPTGAFRSVASRTTHASRRG